MRLKNILKNLDIISLKNFKNYNIKSIVHESHNVVPSSMFICIKGNTFNGNDFIADAKIKGAKCIVTEDEYFNDSDLSIVVVKDVRIAMSIVAKNFYNSCVDSMSIVGIVGTCGKTSTSIILSQILSSIDNKIGIIGTNGIFIGDVAFENRFTTPDPIEMHYIFYQMKMLGVKTVVMEVSAQAIYYKKIYGINFDICVFTNISKEHIDFFGSYENYAKTKMDFFNKNNMKECVINIDDFYGMELAYKTDCTCVSYGIESPANSFAIDINLSLDRLSFVANILDDVFMIDVPLVGRYNVYNILASLTVAKLLGFNKSNLENSIKNIKTIDGRYNIFNIKNKKIIVDFAHTPESIDKLLSHIATYSSSRIISLFGCVGYSDKEKRIDMGRSVAKYSDMIILTADNPGNTKLSEIYNDIILGLNEKKYMCIDDREDAINYAFGIMKENDILVLIGKGVEKFQKLGYERVPYCDVDVVLKLMEKNN